MDTDDRFDLLEIDSLGIGDILLYDPNVFGENEIGENDHEIFVEVISLDTSITISDLVALGPEKHKGFDYRIKIWGQDEGNFQLKRYTWKSGVRFERLRKLGLLQEIEITNFSGFKTPTKIVFAGYSNITFLVGPNNSGKSIIGRALGVIKTSIVDAKFIPADDNDFNNHNTDEELRIILKTSARAFNLSTQKSQYPFFHDIALVNVVKKTEGVPIGRYFRNHYIMVGEKKSHNLEYSGYQVNKRLEVDFYTSFIARLDESKSMNSSLVNTMDDFINSVQDTIAGSLLIFSPSRGFEIEKSEEYYCTGNGLLNWLKNPDHKADKTKLEVELERICKNIGIAAPERINFQSRNESDENSREKLTFEFNRIPLTPEEIGSGVSMIYIFILELLINPKIKVVFIEEIENHLHPGLIRSLITELRNLTYRGNPRKIQWILTTHSSTVLDTAVVGDEIYRLEKSGNECRIHPFINGREDIMAMRKAANSLGGLPGDALLSNVVIWVEGPTDLKWIRSLLKAYFAFRKERNSRFPYLIDGLHYSIIMTGGALISHYQFFEDNGLETGISVTRVNPNPFVIIDGDGLADRKLDKKLERANTFANQLRKQNEAYESKRVKDFLEGGKDESDDRLTNGKVNNFWWLKGKEIENYCPPALMKEFIESMAGELDKKWQIEVFSTNAGEGFDWIKGKVEEKLKQIEKKVKDFKKIDLANFVSERLTMEHLKDKAFQDSPAGKDLMDGLERLVGFVLAVNEMEG